ncbi:MAG: ATP-binding protein [Microthrixaceae bacterium]|nr:ATP-binding protein [Microthrixaceae bacterium]MCO5311786.1 ATP-binding protein [Microthrixaceae bacterium]
MDPRSNPYNPGAGLRPFALTGRDDDIEAVEVLADRATRGLMSRSMVFSGLRGVGKTVLLNELAGRTQQRNWFTVQIEADRSHPERFARSLAVEFINGARSQRRWFSKRNEQVRDALRTITSFQISLGLDGFRFDIDLDRSSARANTGDLYIDLADLATSVGVAASESGIGVALFIDEMQDLTAEQMSAVCRSCHLAAQRHLPWFVIGGGLPNLPKALAEAESYAERLFEYRTIDRLGDEAARSALVLPTAAADVVWANDACEFALSESGGYPYFIQQFGKSTWDAAIGPSTISLDDATFGIAEGQQQLDHGFYASRWERATPTERRFLEAMAPDDGASSASSDVAGRLGKSLSSLGPARASLINKGIVYSPEHGSIAFTVPGMADFVRRRARAERP